MGRLVLGVVGGVVGYFAGGPSGAYYGFAIGYGVGALTEEPPKVEGPRLSDLRFTSSQYGQPIPWIRGAPRVSGQIVWASTKREVSSTSGGKGGEPEVTDYTYEIDVLVLLCDHPAYAVARIWSNGKLVWTRRATASDDSLAASDFSNLWRRMQFYSGSETQLPDATYEAAVGVGNAPAYRGRSTLMLEGLQLGTSGQLPNLTFEVLQSGTESLGALRTGASQSYPGIPQAGTAAAGSETVFRVAIPQWTNSYASTLVQCYDIDALSSEVSEIGTFNVDAAGLVATGHSDVPILVHSQISATTAWRAYSVPSGSFVAFTMPVSIGKSQARFAKAGGDIVFGSSTFGGGALHRFNAVSGGAPVVSSAALPDYVNSILIFGSDVYAAAKNNKVIYRLDLATLTLQETINRPAFSGPNSDTWPWLFNMRGELALLGQSPTGSQYRIYVRRASSWVELQTVTSPYVADSDRTPSIGVVGSMLVSGLIYTSVVSYITWAMPLTLEPDDISLQSVVEGLCERAGMPAGAYDATALASVTRPVRSLAVTSGATRGTMEQLAAAFFFQCSLRDKLYFRPRGGSVAASIPWSDLAASSSGEGADDQSLPLNIGNELELPPQVAVSYINVNDDAQAGTEYSDRMTVGQAAVRTLSLGIGMTPSEAKGVADAVVADTAAALVTGAVALPISYARLDPADVVEVIDSDGRTYRLRLERKRDERGVLAFEVAADDPSAIVSQQITDTTQTGAVNVTKPGDTVLQALDVPLLRDADNAPGFYVAAKGSTTNWPGGQALISSNNVDYVFAAEINESAVFGTCTTTLGNYTGIGFDERNSLTVSVGNGELASTTRDAMLADETINALLVGSEIVRFRTASLVSPGVYTVSGLLRGQRGTEWAMAGHVASERCVLLRTRGLRRVTQDAGENGQLRYLRGATLGATPKNTTTQITNTNVGLKPLAPVDIRAEEQSGQNLLLSWRRRSRLSARFLASGGVPLGESSEGYVVRLYAPPSTLRRTITVAGSSSVVYTRAQQIADGFSAGSDIRVDVAQLSAVVGEGYVGTGTVRAAAQSVPQIFTITLGGTFQDGTHIRVVLGSVTVNYTTTVGDADLDGAATSLASAITGAGTYTAAAVGPVVNVSGPTGVVYSATAEIVNGDNTVSVDLVQAAVAASAGQSYYAYTYVSNTLTGVTEPVPSGTTFSVQIQRPVLTTLYSFSYTTSGSETRAQVHSGLSSAAAAAPGLYAAGYRYGSTIDPSGTPAGYVIGPSGTDNVFVATSGSPPFGLSVSVLNPGAAAVPTALPQIVEFTFAGTVATGWVYRVTLAGVDFDYTAVGGDDMTDVAAGLAALIDAEADYIASAAGAVLEVEHASNNVPFTYSARVLSSTITVDSEITQQAA